MGINKIIVSYQKIVLTSKRFSKNYEKILYIIFSLYFEWNIDKKKKFFYKLVVGPKTSF